MGEMRNAYELCQKIQREEIIQEGNVRIDLREGGWQGVEWVYLIQNRDQ
jgi:hypothetical protein